jgi:predicted cation transporter
MTAGLIVIILLVFALPLFVKKIGEELEIFLFIMGLAAVTAAKAWSRAVIGEALVEPVKIALVVLVAGIVFRYTQNAIARHINKIEKKTGLKLFVFLTVTLLGLLSSVITAIIAALVLVEIAGHLQLDKKSETKLVIMTCFSIGLGAALTPIGEPLSAIATGKLSGGPHHAGFWFLFIHTWFYIIPCVLVLGVFAAFFIGGGRHQGRGFTGVKDEGLKQILIRTGRIYIFVAGLVLLGSGFAPLAERYVSKMPFYVLYWINLSSAALDNATLAAAEIGPSMSLAQVVAAMLGLVIAGGMLVPGNIPNIISAGKLGIKSREWAVIGIPVGAALMIIFFIIIFAGGIK